MAKNTIFQNLNNILFGSNSVSPNITRGNAVIPGNQVLFSTNDKDEYERKLTQFKQQKLLSYQWAKAGADTTMESLAGYTAVKLMYRDADLMDGTPEIGAALDIMSEEACPLNSEGKMLNIYSKSKRVKSILEDLFVNRLSIHATLPMITRATCKYGNDFMLLNVDMKNGVMGWKRLPVYEMDRIENGYTTANMAGAVPQSVNDIKPDETKFVWVGHNDSTPYLEWQVAHFRLLNDSFFLPYGVSCLHKARRAWRMWMMMEDSMLIYRLDKSIERRVFKVFVGAIDDKDVPAFINEFANNFKRTPVIDPLTGQVDLRKNFLDVSSDYFIPVRDPNAPTPIETLSAANNSTSMDDIEYMQRKVFAGLGVPKTFLNYSEAQGKGQNLSLLDVRFSRKINRIQQCVLMELNKIAMYHLFILGFGDEITNFTLSLNNPSAQIEALELEDLTKRIQTASAALADPGIGMPLLSLHYVLKKIMKMTDSEIKDMLNEIRLEKAMAAELEQTANIIKKTGIFDTVDRIYGDYDAMNAPAQAQGQEDDGMMGGNAGGGGGGFDGGSLMSDALGGGADDMGDIGGEESSMDMGDAPAADEGSPMEHIRNKKPLIYENRKSFIEKYFEKLTESQKNTEGVDDITDFEEKNRFINEQVSALFDKVDNIIENSLSAYSETNFDEFDNEVFDIDDDNLEDE